MQKDKLEVKKMKNEIAGVVWSTVSARRKLRISNKEQGMTNYEWRITN